MNQETLSIHGHKDDPDTRTRLIDAAECLFAEKGVKGTSIRELSRKAGVNLAAVNYHFGSKEGLVKAVFARRIRPINNERRKRIRAHIEQARKHNMKPSVRKLVEAFVEPVYAMVRSSSSTYFVAFVGRAMADPDPAVRILFIKEMKETIRFFFSALEQALPDLPRERLILRLQFLLGAMGHLYSGRFRLGSLFKQAQQIDALDDSRVLDEFITFATAGLEADLE